MKDNYCLALNGNLSYETQYQTFAHDLKHIVTDMPNMGYFIGLDMQWENFEVQADGVIL